MLHLLVSILCVCGLIGVVYCNFQNRLCFQFWTLSNAGFIMVDCAVTGLYERALLHAVYFLLAIHGYYQWGKKEAKSPGSRRRYRTQKHYRVVNCLP